MADNEPKPQVDGNSDWSGGMDTSRNPSFISPNQFVYSVNMDIPPTFGGIKTRSGFRCLEIVFNTPEERGIYEQGIIQGEGWYYNGNETILLCSVNGWIFEFRNITRNILSGKIINGFSQNNPKNPHAWFTRVPYGSIMNDGESLPFIIRDGEIRRSDPDKNEITVGMMGVYVQNRFFYVRPDRKNIFASTILDPTSLQEAYDAGIYGFVTPEDEDFITAIGRQQTISRDAQGGNLSFSSLKNTYSADVRGDRNNWGKQGAGGVGYVNNAVPNVGAVSAYSYESFNANIYFRNLQYGFMSSKQAQYQFQNNDSYYSHSIEARLFFENDTPIFLSKCYTRGYGPKLYTTIAPEFSDNGGIIWSGIIVYAPDIYYSKSEKAERRYESVYTGIRPWCLTVTEDVKSGSRMFIHSRDHDNVNRIYLFDEDINYDVDKDGNKIIIESKLLTRSYNYGTDFVMKKATAYHYALKDVKSNTSVKIKTRVGESEAFKDMWDGQHFVNECCIKSKNGQPCFYPIPIHPEERENVPVSIEKDAKEFYSRQFLFTIKGESTLKKWVMVSNIVRSNQNVTVEKKQDPNCYEEETIFNYHIHGN